MRRLKVGPNFMPLPIPRIPMSKLSARRAQQQVVKCLLFSCLEEYEPCLVVSGYITPMEMIHNVWHQTGLQSKSNNRRNKGW
ncbi:hypothetical protein [Sphingobacterium detergens]